MIVRVLSKALRSRPYQGLVYLCNIPGGVQVARLLRQRCRVLEYDWPSSTRFGESGSITFLRIEPEHMNRADTESLIEHIAARARNRGGFIVLCATPRLGQEPRIARMAGRSNALAMRIAAQANLGFFDLDLILARRGMTMLSIAPMELSESGTNEVAEEMRSAIEEFKPRVRPRVSSFLGIFRCST